MTRANTTVTLEQVVADRINNHTYIVDQNLLDVLQQSYDEAPAIQKRENADALALEKTLQMTGKIKVGDKLPNEKYQWRHDWWEEFDGEDYFIDLKRKPQAYKNASISGKEKMTESYNLGQLTHLVAFETNIERITKETIGRTLRFRFLKIATVKAAWKESYEPENSYRLWPVENNSVQLL